MIRRSSLSPCSLSPIIATLLASAVLAAPALSQAPPDPTPQPILTYDQAWMQAAAAESRNSGGYASIGYSPAIQTIPGKAFTAQRVYSEWDRQGDPNVPIVSTTVTIARDTLGRVHYESSTSPGEVTVMLSDSVAHINYQYAISQSAPNLTVTSCTQPQLSQISQATPTPDPNAAPDTSPTTPAVAAPVPPPSSKTELGTSTIENTLVYGQQRSDFIALPVGTKSMLTEDWFSPNMGLNLKEVSDYSGQNKFSVKTQNVQPGDPDPNLFALPPGYTLSGPAESCIPPIS